MEEISFSPQPSAAIKIKDGGHNFCQQNTEHSLAKITLLCRLEALQKAASITITV